MRTSLQERVRSWADMKRWVMSAARVINALSNIRIVRSGIEDSVTVSDTGVLIKIKDDKLGSGPSIPGQSNPGLLIYRANGTQEFFPAADILVGYNASTDDNWSLSFAVSNSQLVAFSTTAPVGTSAMPTGEERFDGNALANPVEAQTYYRIPVVRTISSVKYAFDITGIYQEDIFCAGSRGGIVHLIKIA